MLYGVSCFNFFFSPIVKVTYACRQLQKIQKSRKKERELPTREAVGTLFFFLIFSLCASKQWFILLVPF